jgi:hypothetical protein
MRLVSCVCILIAAASCLRGRAVESQKSSEAGKQTASSNTAVKADSADVLTVFLTGNELGALKPCGCSGGQLGGLERRPAVLNTAPAAKRVIVDTGSFTKTDGEQDQIKFQILIDALDMLGYDLVNLTEQDIEMAKTLALLERRDSGSESEKARADNKGLASG